MESLFGKHRQPERDSWDDVSPSGLENGDSNNIYLNCLASLAPQNSSLDGELPAAFTEVTLEELLTAIKATESKLESETQNPLDAVGFLGREAIVRILQISGANPAAVGETLSELRASREAEYGRLQHLKQLEQELVLPNTKLGLSASSSRQQRNLEETLAERISPLISAIQLTDKILQQSPARIREIASTDGEVNQLWKYSNYHRDAIRTELFLFSIALYKSDFYEWRWTANDIATLPLTAFVRILSSPIDDRRGTYTDNFTYRTPVLRIDESPSLCALRQVADSAHFDVKISFETNHRGKDNYAQIKFALTHKAANQKVPD